MEDPSANPDFVSRTFARRDVLLATAAVVLPFLVFAGYLAIAVPNYRQRDLSADFIAVYVPSMAGLLMIFAFYFVCAAFGDCL